MRWIAVFLAAVALAGCSGGNGDQPPQAQTEAQASPQAQPSSPVPARPQAQTPPVVLEGALAPRQVRWAFGPPPWLLLVAARVHGRTVRYVLKSDTPARALKHGMSSFLYSFRFGEKGRPMVVRLLDGEGRFAWAAEYDGVQKISVRARSDLARCGSIWNGEGRRLPNAPGAADAPRCPVERLPDSNATATSASLLR